MNFEKFKKKHYIVIQGKSWKDEYWTINYVDFKDNSIQFGRRPFFTDFKLKDKDTLLKAIKYHLSEYYKEIKLMSN